ncbi:hypothetical protein BDV59DRAFT_187753 [Aspergillus ambiguus]|uniref:uncharacterized protein n=1 Tax=Aspergillus ambiguus TaxID=176160 RepID=UPI003CCCA9C9
MSVTATYHQALAKNILREHFGLKATVTSRGYGRSNHVFEVKITNLTTTPVVYSGAPQPGTETIPAGTARLIFRFFRPFDTFNESARAENKVASMELARRALSHVGMSGLVPRVHGWNRGTDEPSNPGWVVEEYIEGTVLADDFSTLPFDKQKVILAQLAKIVKAFQDYKLPDTVLGFGGCAFDSDGQIISGPPSFQCKGGPFQSIAELYKGILGWQLEATDRHENIGGWRDSRLRGRLEAFVAQGVDSRLSQLTSDRPTFVHGGLELIKTLYDPQTLRLTAVIDYGLSQIAVPLVEYLSSFGSISGMLGAPYDPETEELRQAILTGFPGSLPDSKPMRQGPAMFGSGRDIQWGLAKAWDEELKQVDALRPCTIDGAETLAQMHWFIQDIAPWHLFDPDILKIRSLEQIQEARKEAVEGLEKYLKAWGFSD